MKKKCFVNFLSVLLCFSFFCSSWISRLQKNYASELDSVLFWKFIGGPNQDLFVQSIAENGYHYIIGNTDSPKLFRNPNIIKSRSISPAYHGFLLCYGNNFDKLLYSVFINGSNTDIVSQMIISKDFIYIIGTTSSSDLPKATNNKSKEQSGFISKINKFNGSIIYSTYLGDQDYDRAIYVYDTENGLFVLGQNDSSNIIVGVKPEKKDDTKTVYSFFITLINSIDGSIKYLKRFAPTEEEQNYLQVIEKPDTFLLALYTDSIDFPLAKYKRDLGKQNIVVAEINKQDGKILRATYFGGNDEDYLYQLLDDGDNFYIFGRSKSENLMGLINQKKSPTDDGFISFFSYQTFSVIWSIYLGGSSQTYIRKAKIVNDSILITGLTESKDFPGLSYKDFQDWKQCNFISKINKKTGTFTFTTILDFSGNSYLDQIYMQDKTIYVLGITKSNIILKSKNRNHGSQSLNETFDGFISRFDFETGILLDSFLFGGEKNDYPGIMFFEKDKILVIGDSLSEKSMIGKEENFGKHDLFSVCFPSEYNKNGAFIVDLIPIPDSIQFSKYWMNWPIGWFVPKTISLTNNGSVTLFVEIKSDSEWLYVDTENITLFPTETKNIQIKLIYKNLVLGDNKGSITLSSQAGIKKIPVKTFIDQPEGKSLFRKE